MGTGAALGREKGEEAARKEVLESRLDATPRRGSCRVSVARSILDLGYVHGKVR